MENYGIHTRIGCLLLSIESNRICRLWLPNESPLPLGETRHTVIRDPREHPLAGEALNQLSAYFAGQLRQFELPLAPHRSTPLQERIRRDLCSIRYGTTTTYKALGPPRTAARVCSHNPLPILIPCHRVLPARGTLSCPGQYRGGTALKRYLLHLEAANV